MIKTELNNTANRFLAKGAEDKYFALTLEEVCSLPDQIDLETHSLVPLMYGQTNASRLAEQVRNELALQEGIFGRVTVALELIEAYESSSDSTQEGSAYYLASVCFPDRPALDQVKGSFVKHKRLPRGIVLVDQQGAPTGLAFEAPNWLNTSVTKGDTWVKPLSHEQSLSIFELPKFEK